MGNCFRSPKTIEENICVAPAEKSGTGPASAGQVSIGDLVSKQTTVCMLDMCDEVSNIIQGAATASTPTRVNDCVDEFISVSSSSDGAYDTPTT